MDIKRTRTSESTKQGSYGLPETEAASTGLHGPAPGPLWTYYSFQLNIFMGLLSV